MLTTDGRRWFTADESGISFALGFTYFSFRDVVIFQQTHTHTHTHTHKGCTRFINVKYLCLMFRVFLSVKFKIRFVWLQLVKRCEEEINQLDRVQNLFPNDQLYLHDKDALSLVSIIKWIWFHLIWFPTPYSRMFEPRPTLPFSSSAQMWREASLMNYHSTWKYEYQMAF